MSNSMFKHVVGDKKKHGDVNAYDENGNAILSEGAEWKHPTDTKNITTYQQYQARAEEMQAQGASNLKSQDQLGEEGIRVVNRTMLSTDRETGDSTANPLYFDMNKQFTATTILGDCFLDFNSSTNKEQNPNYPRLLNVQEPIADIVLHSDESPVADVNPKIFQMEIGGVRGTAFELINSVEADKNEIDDLVKGIVTKQVGFSNAVVGIYGQPIDGTYTLDAGDGGALDQSTSKIKYPALTKVADIVTLTVLPNVDTVIPVIFTPKDTNKYAVTKMNAHLNVIDRRNIGKNFVLKTTKTEVTCHGNTIEVPANVAIAQLKSDACTGAKGCAGALTLSPSLVEKQVTDEDDTSLTVTTDYTLEIGTASIPADPVCASAKQLVRATVKIKPSDTHKNTHAETVVDAIIAIQEDARGVAVTYHLTSPSDLPEVTLGDDNANQTFKGQAVTLEKINLTDGKIDGKGGEILTGATLKGKLTTNPEITVKGGKAKVSVDAGKRNPDTGLIEGSTKGNVLATVVPTETTAAATDMALPLKVTDNRPEMPVNPTLSENKGTVTLTGTDLGKKGSAITIPKDNLKISGGKGSGAVTVTVSGTSSDVNTTTLEAASDLVVESESGVGTGSKKAKLSVKGLGNKWYVNPLLCEIEVTVTDNRTEPPLP